MSGCRSKIGLGRRMPVGRLFGMRSRMRESARRATFAPGSFLKMSWRRRGARVGSPKRRCGKLHMRVPSAARPAFSFTGSVNCVLAAMRGLSMDFELTTVQASLLERVQAVLSRDEPPPRVSARALDKRLFSKLREGGFLDLVR